MALWTNGKFEGTVSAGQDAWVVSLADLTLNLTAGRDALTWSIGNADEHLTAGRNVQAASWDSAARGQSLIGDRFTLAAGWLAPCSPGWNDPSPGGNCTH